MSVFEEKTDMRLDWVMDCIATGGYDGRDAYHMIEDINQVVEELDAALMVVANLKTENAKLKSENEMLRKMIEPPAKLPGLKEWKERRGL